MYAVHRHSLDRLKVINGSSIIIKLLALPIRLPDHSVGSLVAHHSTVPLDPHQPPWPFGQRL